MNMFQGIQILYDVYKGIKDESGKMEFLRNVIRNEAKLNNDISNVISRSDPKIVAAQMPELFQQLDTSSYDLLIALGIAPHKVFDEKRDPTFEELKKLDLSRNSFAYYKKRPQVELYEFYIIKSKLLSSLAHSNSISQANVILVSRIRNIEYATRALSSKLRRKSK